MYDMYIMGLKWRITVVMLRMARYIYRLCTCTLIYIFTCTLIYILIYIFIDRYAQVCARTR